MSFCMCVCGCVCVYVCESLGFNDTSTILERTHFLRTSYTHTRTDAHTHTHTHRLIFINLQLPYVKV